MPNPCVPAQNHQRGAPLRCRSFDHSFFVRNATVFFPSPIPPPLISCAPQLRGHACCAVVAHNKTRWIHPAVRIHSTAHGLLAAWLAGPTTTTATAGAACSLSRARRARLRREPASYGSSAPSSVAISLHFPCPLPSRRKTRRARRSTPARAGLGGQLLRPATWRRRRARCSRRGSGWSTTSSGPSVIEYYVFQSRSSVPFPSHLSCAAAPTLSRWN